MTDPHTPLRDFEAELAAVDATLSSAADELGMPLGELVRSRIRRNSPHLRAAVILAIADGPEEDATLRGKRISLAGALEMLYVAMQVHRLLLGNARVVDPGDADAAQDRTFMGGAILAGDYCFSRAAQMAARTDNPQVVRIFAQTLQTVSEGQLRKHFEIGKDAEFDENAALLTAGAEAAAALAGLDEDARRQAIALGREVAIRWRDERAGLAAGRSDLSEPPTRRQALQHWLAAQAAQDIKGIAPNSGAPVTTAQ